jgi:hypothetical protein
MISYVYKKVRAIAIQPPHAPNAATGRRRQVQ